MNGKILLVEDDESLGFVIRDNLEEAGYQVQWQLDGRAGRKAFHEGSYDLCLVDVMLPRLDGFGLAREIRATNEFVPILFLTARSMEEDKLMGFEIGGDDYITKPFSLKELLYRVQVFMRRTGTSVRQQESTGMLQLGNYSFDRDNLLLTNNGQVQSLTKMEADLLAMLIRSRNVLVKRSDILIAIWGEDDYFKGRSLDVFISRLRKYLQKDPTLEIKNHHGVGFTLRC